MFDVINKWMFIIHRLKTVVLIYGPFSCRIAFLVLSIIKILRTTFMFLSFIWLSNDNKSGLEVTYLKQMRRIL